jgi:putative hydrolase of HD superfamily
VREPVRPPFAHVGLPERLAAQLAFCLEADKVKQVLRRNTLADGSRPEDDAQHMWHLALMAFVLAEHAAEPVDVLRVVTMVLVHDLVEIDAGDAYVYDPAARAAAEVKERAAADRIFGLLPADQGRELRGLWEEFEANVTADARFARALDRIQPILQNAASGGRTWREHGIDAGQVADMLGRVGPGAPRLHQATLDVLAAAVDDGVLPARPAAG